MEAKTSKELKEEELFLCAMCGLEQSELSVQPIKLKDGKGIIWLCRNSCIQFWHIADAIDKNTKALEEMRREIAGITK